jgi:hypothetical protein
MKDLMKKFNMAELKPLSTPMSMVTTLDLDKNGEVVDQREYRSMIIFLLYIMATQPDIQFVGCLCARFQASTHSSDWTAVQQIFKYLKYILKFEIWYSTSSSLYLVGFSDADFASYGIDRKSLLVHAIFLDLFLFVGLLTNSLLSHNTPQSLSM